LDIQVVEAVLHKIIGLSALIALSWR